MSNEIKVSISSSTSSPISDVELWHLLVDDRSPESLHADPVVSLAAVEGIAALPLEQRIAYFAPIQRLADHPSPGIRVAVLRVLSGGSGWRVRRHLVAALDDSESDVRATALEVIMRCPSNVALIAHAAFHPREDVRLATITRILGNTDRPTSEAVCALPLYLLADTALRDSLLSLIATNPLSGLLPSRVYDFHRHSLIDDEMARSLVLRTVPIELECELADDLAKAMDKPSTLLSWLIAGFWPSPDSPGIAADELTSAFYPHGIFGFLTELLRNKRCPGLEYHFFEACSNQAVLTRNWSPRAIEAMLFADDDFLRLASLPEITRPMLHRAMRVCYRMGRESPEMSRHTFVLLITSRICRHESGNLDLWAIGAFMHRRRKDGFDVLTKLHNTAALVSAFWDNPEESSLLFAYSEPSKERDAILHAIHDAHPGDPRIIALWLLLLSTEGEQWLSECTGQESLAVVRCLARLSQSEDWRLPSKRCRAIAQQLASKWCAEGMLNETTFNGFLLGWLGDEWGLSTGSQPSIADLARFQVGADLLAIVANSMPSAPLVERLVHDLPARVLETLADAFSYIPGLPYAFEVSLAKHLSGHESEALSTWSKDRLTVLSTHSDSLVRGSEPDGGSRRADESGVSELSDADVSRIQSAAPHLLHDALQSARQGRRTRVAEALRLRHEPSLREEKVAACVALLACADAHKEVFDALDRYLEEDDSFCDEVTAGLLPLADARGVGSIGCAWLHRWEKYAFQLGDAEFADAKSVITWLHLAIGARSRVLGTILFASVARVLAIWTARQRPRAAELYDSELTWLLVDQLMGPHGETAAWMLVRAAKADFDCVANEATRKQVTDLLPALTDSVRLVLAQWIDVDSFGAIKVVTRTPMIAIDAQKHSVQLESFDLDSLTAHLSDHRLSIVIEAISRLVQHGRAGVSRLLQALAAQPPLAHASTIADSASGWPRECFGEVFGEIQSNDGIKDWLRFLIAINLIEAGDEFRNAVHEWLIELLLKPCSESWFQAMDHDRWWAVVREDERDALQLRMVLSSHPFVYMNAVEYVLDKLRTIDESAKFTEDAAEPLHGCLVRFLKLGSDRDRRLRAKVANALHRRGDSIGYPLLLADALQAQSADHVPSAKSLKGFLGGGFVVGGPLFGVAVNSLLCAGEANVPEATVLEVVKDGSHEPAMQDLIHSLLAEAVSDSVRRAAAVHLRSGLGRQTKLRRVAEVFRRGVAMGRELTGRLFTIEMIGGAEFGYTRLNENRIYVNPMPVFKNVPHADDIVEGLILHEFGHHVYHRGTEANRVWERASQEGLGKLLNLVADEHLERNLRAMNKHYDAKLKRLAVYAFNRNAKDYPLDTILSLLGCRAFATLVENPPSVARDPDSLLVRGGAVLLAMDKAGQSFSRFFRALRLGLGDRTGDLKVAAALALFGKQFRQSTMQELYQVTLELRKIFGDDANLLNWLCSDSLVLDAQGDLAWHGEGLTNAEIQREVERITRPPRTRGDAGRGRLVINVGDDEDFEKIHQIDRLPYLPDAYRNYVPAVAAPARQLRHFFKDLGVKQVPVYRRTRGRSLDRSRLQSLVIRRDPRVMISREYLRLNDLFLAVAIDCSGSMQVDDNIEKAKMFAALMAESCRGLGGVDLRLFGFRHDIIHDAGDADRPAFAGLEAGGGNNDAAALWHAAQLAFESSRKSKVLVMISDGLPTECTTTALKSLVTRLSRRGVCCAQVAVRPISEVCFPHYVELSETDLPNAVRRFGGIVARLVESTLR